MEAELGKLGEIIWLYHILQPNDEEVSETVTTHTTQWQHLHDVPMSSVVLSRPLCLGIFSVACLQVKGELSS